MNSEEVRCRASRDGVEREHLTARLGAFYFFVSVIDKYNTS